MPAADLKFMAARGVRYSGLSTSTVTLVGFLQTAILGRILGPGAWGLMAMVYLCTGFAGMFAEMGLADALIQRKNPTRRQLAGLYWLNVGSGTAMYLLTVAAAPWIAIWFSQPELRVLLPVAALPLAFGAWGSQFAVLANKHLHFRFLAVVRSVAAVLGFGVALVSAAWLDQGVWSLVWGSLVGAAFTTVANIVYGLRRFGFPGFRFRFDELKGYISFGAYGLGSNLLNYANSNADQFVIGTLLGPQVLGYYRMAVNLVLQPILQINPMLTRVAFPVFSRIQEDTARMQRGFLKMIRLLMMVDGPIFFGLALVSPVAVPLIMGDQWLPSVPLIQVLVFYGMIRSIASAGGSVIMAKGKANWAFFWNLALTFLVPPVVYLAARGGDAVTVAWSLVALQVVLWGFSYFYFLRRLLGPFLLRYVWAFGLPVLVSAGMAVVVLGVAWAATGMDAMVRLVGEIAAGAIAYLLLASVFMRNDATEAIRLALGRTGGE